MSCSCDALAVRVTCLEGQVAALTTRDEELLAKIEALEDITSDVAPFETGVYGITADAGSSVLHVAEIADIFQAWALDGAFFAGDNNYGGDIESDWNAFAYLVTAGKAFPAMGNHDLDKSDGYPTRAKFDDLFHGLDYYVKDFPKGNVTLFVLDSGYLTNLTMREADGNTVGSVQYAWFVNQSAIARAKGRRLVVMFHHPIMTIVAGGPTFAAMDWFFEAFGVSLVINGHDHANTHFIRSGVHYINISIAAQAARAIIPGAITDPTQILGEADGAFVVWTDIAANGTTTGMAACARLTAMEGRMLVEVVRAPGALTLHSFYC